MAKVIDFARGKERVILKKARASIKWFSEGYESVINNVVAVHDSDEEPETKFDIFIRETNTARDKVIQAEDDNNRIYDAAICTTWLINGAFKLFVDHPKLCSQLTWYRKRKNLLNLSKKIHDLLLEHNQKYSNHMRAELHVKILALYHEVTKGTEHAKLPKKVFLFYEEFRWHLQHGRTSKNPLFD